MVDQASAPAARQVGSVSIKVIGVGGGGSNAVTRMYREPIPEVQYIAANTDHQALSRSDVPTRLRIGDKTARGLGVGGEPAKGRDCADESRDEVRQVLQGADLVFVAAGMGGGTGTGAAPVVAEIARDLGALTVGVVTRPFRFEGGRRAKQAEEGIAKLQSAVDTLIVVPNDRLIELATDGLTMAGSFKLADDVLRQGIQAIAELILVPGEINLDFADVKTVMKSAGRAWMAIGRGTGPGRAIQAAEQAIASPLLEVSIDGAKGIIFNVTGGQDLTLSEVHDASEVITRYADPEANIIFGAAYDSSMENEVKLTVIATGFPGSTGDGYRSGPSREALREALTRTEAMDLPPFLRTNAAARRRFADGASLSKN